MDKLPSPFGGKVWGWGLQTPNAKQKILDIGFLMLNSGKWTNSLHLLGEGLGKGALNTKQVLNV